MKISIIKLNYQHPSGEQESGQMGIISEDGIEIRFPLIEDYLLNGEYIMPEYFNSIDPENTPKFSLAKQMQEPVKLEHYTQITDIQYIDSSDKNFKKVKETLEEDGLLIEYKEFTTELVNFPDYISSEFN